jgi:hypothetical protein
MSKENKVYVQKGEINPAEKTLKTMSHKERQEERVSELSRLKEGQTLKFYKPKQ